ncbi:unnamed protein product [Ilex paraguariensis]|uniref:non-specific serine/threonine protein kinase n=1 Tax=Ilex paraguariensis TaxID=185542 RepID=A0ABC8UX73_9AQUA
MPWERDYLYGGAHQNRQHSAPSPGFTSNPQLYSVVVPSPPPAPSVSSSLCSEKLLAQSSSGIGLRFSKITFTYEELARATDSFSSRNLLGQGGFGYVHKGFLPSGKEVAIKQLKVGSGQGEREFQAEVEIINHVHHRHLVSLVGYCISGAQRLLVYEFVPNSTLEFHLHGKGQPPLNWATRMKIAVDSAKGLAYLHEDYAEASDILSSEHNNSSGQPKIIHRDIKAANILLDYNFEAKVVIGHAYIYTKKGDPMH